jgi:hypothetical protein
LLYCVDVRFNIYNHFSSCIMLSILVQWLETEIVRLSHLRDRASEKGRRKEYPLLYNTFFFLIIIIHAVGLPLITSYLYGAEYKVQENEP